MVNTNRSNWAYLIAALAGSYFLFAPYRLYFLNDDLLHLGLSAKGEFFQRNSFRPAHELLLYLESKIWGVHPYGYHLVGWAIHVACCCCYYPFAIKWVALFEEENPAVPTLPHRQGNTALIASLLFSVYAFHSESLLWLLGSGASLAGLFFLMACLAYFQRRVHWLWFAASMLCFQAGLFTYEAIWCAPLVFFCISWQDSRKDPIRKFSKEYPYLIIMLLAFGLNLVFRTRVLGELAGSYGASEIFGAPLKKLVYNVFCLLARSIAPPFASTFWFLLGTFVSFVLLGILIFLGIRFNKNKMLHLATAFCFLGSLLPVLPLGISTHSRESERFLYLPSIFFTLALVHAIRTIVKGTLNRAVILFIVISIHVWFSLINARDYTVAGSIAKIVNDHGSSVNKGTTDQNWPIRLPVQFNGIPIYRTGYPEALYYLSGMGKTPTIDTGAIELIPKRKYYLHPFKRDFGFQLVKNTAESNKKITLEFNAEFFTGNVWQNPKQSVK